MQYSQEVENMCPVAKGAYHGPAPIPEEGKWVQAKEISDISGLTHGVGWCAPQQGACTLTLTVKDGKVTAKIVWSSKNYDYMKVGDTNYDAGIEDEHSTFEIPVSCFDWAMAVKADTTAMSEAHELAYTLTFDSASVAPLSK